MPLPFVRVLAVWVSLASMSLAGPVTPIDLAPVTHAEAALVIMHADGTETRYSPADLEQFDTYRLQTTTPWREVPATFDGVLLRDLLAANGLADTDEIIVTAENDFTTNIPRAVWETLDILVATRVNGAAHRRRARGPIQFVIDMASFRASPHASDAHLVWMAARIEAARP